jgi:hypothetical protein
LQVQPLKNACFAAFRRETARAFAKLTEFCKRLCVLILCAAGLPLCAQADTAQLAPNAENQVAVLLNKPAMVSPAAAKPLGKNWFTLELDTHVFTDQASFKQIVAVLLDIENQDKTFDGKKNKLRASIVSRGAGETIVDFVSVTPAPLGIQIKTTYRASVKTLEYTDTKFLCEIKQLPQDTNSNKDNKNLYATRYVEEVTIGGKKYVYIRVYSTDDINASILPGAKNTLENSSAPANEEALLLIINAAKAK